MFGGSASSISELHFGADNRTIIQSAIGYNIKFGCLNATIYFDL